MQVNVGSYRLKFSGNLLTFYGQGPWDKAAVLRYKSDMESAIHYFAGKKWGFLGYLSGEALLTPEAEDYLSNVSTSHAAQGMQASAIILADTIYPAIVRSQAERVYNHAGIVHGFFDNEEKAIFWINNQGYFQ